MVVDPAGLHPSVRKPAATKWLRRSACQRLSTRKTPLSLRRRLGLERLESRETPAVYADTRWSSYFAGQIIRDADPAASLRQRAADYAPGDTDLTWTVITPWRAALASVKS